MTRLTSVAICCRTGAGRVLVGFLQRRVAMPRWLSRSSMRSRNTSPRGLAMSNSPIASPSRRSGRDSRGRIVELRSDVVEKHSHG